MNSTTMELSTCKNRYNVLKKNPLLFLHLVRHHVDDHHAPEELWEPLDNDIYGNIPSKVHLGGNYLETALVVAESIENQDTDVHGNVAFNVHPVDPSKLEDWKIVIDSLILRSQNVYDKYPFIHLLWVLNYCNWSGNIISRTLTCYYKDQAIPFIVNEFSRISRCLSYDKQIALQQVFNSLGYQFDIYNPSVIADAFSLVNPSNRDSNHLNLFQRVDYVLLDIKFVSSESKWEIKNTTNNLLLCLYNWLNDKNAIIDYLKLGSLFSISSISIQFKIVKRYFHDIRLGKTVFDSNIVKEFKDNRYADFIRYRHCLESPEAPIDLSVPLLCDCVLTLCQSNGRTFQTYNGILDFAISQCDMTKPDISLGIEKILPQCNGGAIYNSDFKGFIDYSIVYELDESKFSEENLLESIKELFTQKLQKHTYEACSLDENKCPLPENAKCLATKTIIEGKIGEKIEIMKRLCTKRYPYPNKWVVRSSDSEWINPFLVKPFPKANVLESFILDISQVSTEGMANYIRSISHQLSQTENGRFVVPSHLIGKAPYNLLLQYSKPVFSRFIPNSNSIIGIEFDVFDILKTMRNNSGIDVIGEIPNEVKSEFKKREVEKVKKQVIETLKLELNVSDFNGSYFEVPYNRDLHLKILGQYYYKATNNDDASKDKPEYAGFLRRKFLGHFIPLCAPKLADVTNKATNLHFYWCRGVECFRSNLSAQTLDKCDSWERYSLFHLVEIIGFPKIKKTDTGLELDDSITEFIACVNRAMRLFKRLKCRNCGHLLYTDRNSGFNRYNNFSCINPICLEYKRSVYLSYCFKCKKGLIDSRDSAKCPNGWYICPECLACCEDELYERQAQRYIIQNQPIPQRLRQMIGKGHNDKDVFYCPSCGRLLETIEDEHGGIFKGCLFCKKRYVNPLVHRKDD